MSADLVFLHGSSTARCVARVDKRFVGYGTLQLITAGAVEVCYGSHCQVLAPGWLWPCQPGPRIRMHPAPGHRSWHHHYVAMTGPRLDRWRLDGVWPHGPQRVTDAAATAELLARVHAWMADPHPWAAWRAATAIEGLLLDLALARNEQPEEPDWLAHAKERLATDHDVDHAALAADCGMAASTFRRRFAASTGMAPREWAMARRMDRARELLIVDDRPIGEIAEELGYHDPALFSRQFSQRCGLSPRRFRASGRDRM